MRNKCSILVSSFDGYSSAWDPFFHLFRKYWPDCPFSVHLITNQLPSPDPPVGTIQIYPDRGWASNLIEALERIDTDYILYMQEDYFLNDYADTAEIMRMLEVISSEEAAYLRLSRKPESIPFGNHSNVGEIPKSADYLNSTQAAFWEKASLLSILKSGESGWDFELRGGIERARKLTKPFLCSQTLILPYLATAIVKGKYIREALSLCNLEGIKLCTQQISLETFTARLARTNPIIKRVKSVIRPLLRRSSDA